MNYFDYLLNSPRESCIDLLRENVLVNLGGLSRAKALFKANVSIVNLETSYQCNRKCDYCPVSTSDRSSSQKLISADLLKKIASELSDIHYENRICLNLYNEPLLDGKLEEKVALLRCYLPNAHLTLNTNGDKLSRKRLADLSDAGLDSICITLHPKPNEENLMNTIQRRVKSMLEKLEVHSGKTDIESGHMTFTESGIRCLVQWPDWRKIGTNRAGTIEKLNMVEVRHKPCAKPFREFTVFFDGMVQPCCEAFHDNQTLLVSMPNLNQKTIFEAYCSPELSRFRRSVFPYGVKGGICRFCNAVDFSVEEDDRQIRAEILDAV